MSRELALPHHNSPIQWVQYHRIAPADTWYDYTFPGYVEGNARNERLPAADGHQPAFRKSTDLLFSILRTEVVLGYENCKALHQ